MIGEELNPAQALVLAVLHSGAHTGADIVRIADGMELWTFSRSQVYREVRTLHMAGAIDALVVDGRSTILSVTTHGRQLYAKWALNFSNIADIQIRDGWYLRYRLSEYDGSDQDSVRTEARSYHRTASTAQRHRGLPDPPPAEAVALSRYHDAMVHIFND